MWLYVVLVGTFPLMYNRDAVVLISGHCGLLFPLEYEIFMAVVNFLLPIVFICTVNVILFLIARRHAKREVSKRVQSHQQQDSISTPIDTLMNTETPSGIKTYKGSKVKSKSFIILKNMKAAKRILLLVGVFLVCWLTYIIIVISNFLCICNPRELIWIGNVINYSSTAINPVLYGFLTRTIRVEVWDKLRRCMRRNFSSLYKYKFMRGPSLFQVRYRKTGIGNMDSRLTSVGK